MTKPPQEAYNIAEEIGVRGENVVYHWTFFNRYAVNEGIDLGHPDDWSPWWKIWLAASEAQALR